MIARDILLGGIGRPEYLTYPEIFLSDLCWNHFEVVGWEARELDLGKRSLGLIYDTNGESGGMKVKLRSTRPDDLSSPQWITSLRDGGLMVENSHAEVSRAIAQALLGVKGAKARRRPATPLTPAVALLQNPVGMTAKAGPAAFGKILEQMYQLGTEGRERVSASPQETAASRLAHAMDRKVSADSILRTIDSAIRNDLKSSGVMINERVASPSSNFATSGLAQENPFSWFRRSWNQLTSDAWLDVLPPRRWTDWLTAVARTAFGFGFLWEMRWFEAVARRIIDVASGADSSGSEEWLWTFIDSRPLLQWDSHKSSVTRRDVTSEVKRTLQIGSATREVIVRLLTSDLMDSEESVDDFFARVAQIPEVVASLKAGLVRESKGSEKNLWEAIRFSLGVREKTGPFADYYGFLQKRGTRFLIVDPTTEWIAVVASLACNSPNQRATLRDVRRELQCLGLSPSVPELLFQLERAGLARSSPDADEGVYVEAAFNG